MFVKYRKDLVLSILYRYNQRSDFDTNQSYFILCLETPHLSALCCQKTVYLPWLCAHHNPHASFAYWISSHGESGWKQKRPYTFTSPLSPSLWRYFRPWNYTEHGLLFLQQTLMESNRRSKVFTMSVAGEGAGLCHCISLVFAEVRHFLFRENSI